MDLVHLRSCYKNKMPFSETKVGRTKSFETLSTHLVQNAVRAAHCYFGRISTAYNQSTTTPTIWNDHGKNHFLRGATNTCLNLRSSTSGYALNLVKESVIAGDTMLHVKIWKKLMTMTLSEHSTIIIRMLLSIRVRQRVKIGEVMLITACLICVRNLFTCNQTLFVVLNIFLGRGFLIVLNWAAKSKWLSCLQGGLSTISCEGDVEYIKRITKWTDPKSENNCTN